jgi:hypothetical protein
MEVYVALPAFNEDGDLPPGVYRATLVEVQDTFDLGSLRGEPALVFQHMEADSHFGASIFWCCRSGAIGGEQAMVEYWQIRREGGKRGIVEVVPEDL